MLSLSSDKTKKPKISTHTLKIMHTADKKKIRRMCTGCYAQIKEVEGRDAARKKGKKFQRTAQTANNSPFFA